MEEVIFYTLAVLLGALLWVVIGAVLLGMWMRADPEDRQLLNGDTSDKMLGGFFALIWPIVLIVLTVVVVGFLLTEMVVAIASWVAGEKE